MARCPRSLLLTVSLAALSLPWLAGFSAHLSQRGSGLIVHEWGTLTSVADRNGQPVAWHPRSDPYGLPNFVEHLKTENFKRLLQGTIRMETPVVYFYSASPLTASVQVRFSRGVITEWYPHASRVEPDPEADLAETALYQRRSEGSIAWSSVNVRPGIVAQFPSDDSGSHYYLARETASAPLGVSNGPNVQQEKFLFYRGVSIFPIPISAQPRQDGGALIKNLGPQEVPGIILFERRGDKMGYRLGGSLQDQAALDRPDLTSTTESLSRDLEDVLTAQGLYPDEAHAMVETWRPSWFEEGSRLFYIVPSAFVDRMLPLSINPVPSQTLRVFVGRIELITPATEQAVLAALANHDSSVIVKTYARFFEPILEQLRAENPARAAELDKELTDTYNTPPHSR